MSFQPISRFQDLPDLGGSPAVGETYVCAGTSPTSWSLVDIVTAAEFSAAVTGTLRFMGATDASGNPNYPAASKGDVYVVSVAGKIGGASGTPVEVGDEYFAIADNAGGTQAAVGASWTILEHNLQGALLSANNLSDLVSVATARTNLVVPTGSGTSTGTNTGDQTITLTGGVAGSGTGSFAATVITNANLTGPVTSVGNATTITNGAVTLAKQADIATASVIGRNTAGSGVPEVLTTLPSGIQDAITRTGTLASGATGAGFTIALTTSTVTGSLADARLSANVPLLNAAQTFSAQQVFLTGTTGTSPAIFRQTGGTAGTHELQTSHTGSVSIIASKSGDLQLRVPSSSQAIRAIDSDGSTRRTFIGSGFHVGDGNAWCVGVSPSLAGSAATILWALNGSTILMAPAGVSGTAYDGTVVGLQCSAGGVLRIRDGANVTSAIICGQPTTSTIGLTVKGIASRTAALLQLQTSAGASLGNVGGTIFNDFTNTSSTNTDGTEDDLYSNTLAANTLAINGDSVHQIEHVQFVGSATAARRLKKYFAGSLFFDSGALTLALGGHFWLETTIIRESSTVVRCSVNVVTTSASSVPYATYTRLTGLTLTGTNILKSTGIASGTGAASGDIVSILAKVFNRPAA